MASGNNLLLAKNWEPQGQEQPSSGNIVNPVKQFILVKHDYRTVKIRIADVLFFEGKGNYVFVYTRDSVIVTLLTMGKLEQSLAAYGFFRIHKSYIVSFQHIEAFWNDKLQVNGKLLPIGGQYRDKFHEYLERFSIAIF